MREQQLGRAFHHGHARQVKRGESAAAIAPWLTAAFLFAGGILIFNLLAGR
jgi:hypothetical protein